SSATLPRPVLGTLRLDNPFVLAPMAGIGDPPYRRLCRRGGAGLVCAEMVSANALHFGDEKSRRMLRTYPDEHPVSLQVFGSDPDRLADAARAAEAAGADVVDLNCGCPVPKIANNGAGISLLKDESLFARCLAAMVKAVKIPVTFKTRLGFRRGENIARRFVQLAESVGVSAVAIHARSREDYHVGPPNNAALREIVESVRIPVFGNGGVRNFADAKRMMDESGCVGVLIGQAAVGNPYLFSELAHAARAGVEAPLPVAQRLALFREHARLIAEFYGEDLGVRRFRKYIPSYVHGLRGSAAFRSRANVTNSLASLLRLIDEFDAALRDFASPTVDIDTPWTVC
ncbi:MAG TPA: tRNA dihydrouridine synthase DusB, partial [Elusimicrobiota bacterium]|nr:tRNA dihydrouridine synthase DusB [Elusimicrobiota bacterium]